jgi:hypothetical protein
MYSTSIEQGRIPPCRTQLNCLAPWQLAVRLGPPKLGLDAKAKKADSAREHMHGCEVCAGTPEFCTRRFTSYASESSSPYQNLQRVRPTCTLDRPSERIDRDRQSKCSRYSPGTSGVFTSMLVVQGVSVLQVIDVLESAVVVVSPVLLRLC